MRTALASRGRSRRRSASKRPRGIHRRNESIGIMEKIVVRGLVAALCAVFGLPVEAAPPQAAEPVALSAAQTMELEGAEEALTLRVNDAIVRPGGVAAAV